MSDALTVVEQSELMQLEATSLTRYDAMRQAIVEAHSIDDVKEIRDKAEALRQYARQAGESLENQNMIAEIKLRAERRAGELLREIPRQEIGRPEKNSNSALPFSSPPTLDDRSATTTAANIHKQQATCIYKFLNAI